MARVTRVKAAQQRYQMVPVLNEDGTPKRTPVMRTDREGNKVQKVTKRGSLVFMDVTVADKDQPLPNRKCGKCSKEIQVGDPYKHTSVKSSYGGTTYYRCASCPDWLPWELSSSLSARAAEISHDFHDEFDGADIESADEVTDMLNSAAERVRELAEEKREGAQNIEDGFGHATMQSDELNDIADQLDSWADDIEGADIPEYPDPEEAECEACEGNGNFDIEEKLEEARKRYAALQAKPLINLEVHAQVIRDLNTTEKLIRDLEQRIKDGDTTVECDECDGAGSVTPDDPTEEQLDEWRSEVESAVSVIDECPV